MTWRRVAAAEELPAERVRVVLECGHAHVFDPALPFAAIKDALLVSTRPCPDCRKGKP